MTHLLNNELPVTLSQDACEQVWKGNHCLYEQYNPETAEVLPLWLEVQCSKIPKNHELQDIILKVYNHLEIRADLLDTKQLMYLARYKTRFWLMFPYVPLSHEDCQKLVMSLDHCLQNKVSHVKKFSFLDARPLYGNWIENDNDRHKTRYCLYGSCFQRYLPVWSYPQPMKVYRSRQYERKYYYQIEPLAKKEEQEFKRFSCINRLMSLYPSEERERISLVR